MTAALHALLLCAMVAACGPSYERVWSPPDGGAGVALHLNPPERPPPPPPEGPEPPPPPPPALDQFLRSAFDPTAAWSVTVFELGHETRRKKSFLGRSIRSRRALEASEAAEIAARLGRNDSYLSGAWACSSPESFGIRLERGARAFDFEVGCASIWLSHGDRRTFALSGAMHERLQSLRPRR